VNTTAVAHVASWQVVLKRWEDGDFSDFTPIVRCPDSQIDDYAVAAFERLKEEQNRLLGR